MKRRSEEEALLKRRAADESLVGRTKKPLGRYRKRKPLDCGRPKCGVCHSDKVCGHEPTRQEELADAREQEQTEDVSNPPRGLK